MTLEPGDIIRVQHATGAVQFYRLVPIETRRCVRCAMPFPALDLRELYCSRRCAETIKKRRYRLRQQLKALTGD